jgi:hypothetical protein
VGEPGWAVVPGTSSCSFTGGPLFSAAIQLEIKEQVVQDGYCFPFVCVTYEMEVLAALSAL